MSTVAAEDVAHDQVDEEWDQVDQPGVPSASGSGEPLLVVAVGLSDEARGRLQEAGHFEVTDALARAGEARLAVVSTRAPRMAVSAALSALRDASCPVVGLVHTGGEGTAVDIMRTAGTGVVAEGNEAALPAFLTGEPHDTGLLESFDRHQSRHGGAADGGQDRDPVTLLAGPRSFRARIEELAGGGDVPRVGHARVLNLGGPGRKLSERAGALVRRRLAFQLQQLAAAYDTELYAVGATELGFVGPSLSPHAAEELGRRMHALAGLFVPTGKQPLAIALGHAGAEVSDDPVALRELSQRAMEVATIDSPGTVVGADTLALGVSSTTELEAAMRLVDHVEQLAGRPPGHAQRVGELAAAMAAQLGYEGQSHSRVHLAALLHDLGKAGLPPEAARGPAGLDGDQLAAYRSHPLRGAAYLRVSAGEEVAAAVRAHHEHWDGSGFPDGLAGEEIPAAARIIAVADAAERVRSGGHPRADAVGALRARAGTELDPELVEVAAELLDPSQAR